MGQTATGRWVFWGAAAGAFLLLMWLLNDILLPFVVGMVVAYFLDPVVVRLQRAGLSRTMATTVVTIVAALVGVGVVMAILPPLFGQVQSLITNAPEYVMKAMSRIQPLLEPLRVRLGLEPISMHDLQSEATQWAGKGLAVAGGIAGALAERGVAIINLLGLLFITPVVTFYMLRDWEKLVAAIDNSLPLEHADTIRKLTAESNAAIAGFVRGQALVCLALGTFYGIGLTLVGLQFGLVIGLVAGAISFIPFVGTFVGGVMALGMALAQFPPDWIGVVKVAAVFVVGQMLEGNFLSPKLVGDRVGLHPVWIMFALLAGGSLFGFTGVLIAVPVAAILGVVVRHFIARYRESALYRGGAPS
ncbi:AI-2E family transporter [Reyranella sp.]|uniref:AI-2E family transporter n=1 Tax=Reyranella sp. TaxID=1929291 RepID=UPI002728059E|nr:AI-2E family transporter [Reyranella sp.]MDO8976651.1 AI-2E family transporter [Reyranella sp.]